jgi:hypothetical protein
LQKSAQTEGSDVVINSDVAVGNMAADAEDERFGYLMSDRKCAEEGSAESSATGLYWSTIVAGIG